MQINDLLKSLLVAMPMLTLAACSSSDNAAQTETAAETAPADQGLSDSELMRQKYEALRQDNTVYFDFDKDEIKGQYAQLLQAHAEFLKEHNAIKVLIEGHTDERGTPEYNISLGERRAKAVAKYMQNLGVDVYQLSVVSYGEEKPADAGHSEDAYAKNRRAVLVY
ncbi:peptidoglycan-associated lipoprotein Pal [Pseudaeromonas sp. ZJS20]|uniref:peptidoglycan-associated lipoprotein Pal n=1 Tax=Pseudaeromonas aegiceratis TaxID=3153928 RepID=UPI00390C7AB3